MNRVLTFATSTAEGGIIQIGQDFVIMSAGLTRKNDCIFTEWLGKNLGLCVLHDVQFHVSIVPIRNGYLHPCPKYKGQKERIAE